MLGSLANVPYRQYGTQFTNYVRTDGYRGDARVNMLLCAEAASRLLSAVVSGADSKKAVGNVATWFKGLQAVKGLVSVWSAAGTLIGKDDKDVGKWTNPANWIHAGYEFFFWGGDALEQGLEASEYQVSDSTKNLIGTARNFGALCGVLTSYEEIKLAWASLNDTKQVDSKYETSRGTKLDDLQDKKACDILRIASAALLLAWTGLQLVGKEFKRIENVLMAFRLTYAFADTMHYIVEETQKQESLKK